jgi:hypothetical protein
MGQSDYYLSFIEFDFNAVGGFKSGVQQIASF